MFVNELHSGGIRAILEADSTVFDNMVVPTGIDLSDTVDHILYKYGDTPLFSPDPSILKYYIGKWSARRLPLWERFLAAVTEDYDPLENYNRSETIKDKFTHGHVVTTDDDLTHGHTITTDDDLTHGETVTTDDDITHGETVTTDDDLLHGLQVENLISADNANLYQPDNKGINSGTDQRDISEAHTGTDERDVTEEHTGTDERDITEEHTGTDERDISEKHTGTDMRELTNTTRGNIGVTTSQQMLNQELDLIPRLDVIEFIADDFKDEFCLLVY